MALCFSLNASHDIIHSFIIGCIMSREKRIDIKDITGQKFFDLTALYIEKQGKYRGAQWRCKCDCGNECIVYGGHLRAGKRKSCGCRSESRITETGVNRVFLSYRRKAQTKNREFDLTRQDVGRLIFSDCFYCGTKPGNELKRMKSKKLQIKYNGIDRFDPAKGYTLSNCVPCCYYCNHAKADFSFDQWVLHLKKIYNHQRITDGI